MAFIKRSTVQPVKATIGTKMIKCSSCGEMLVSCGSGDICARCISQTINDSKANPLGLRIPKSSDTD